MELIFSIVIGIMYAAGVYLLLRRSIVKLILGIIFLGNATNLLILLAGGLTSGAPAFIEKGSGMVSGRVADPLPQALILTAIVIGFGITAFALALMYRFYQISGTDDIDQVTED
ncbi:MAG: Na+/H+ antiporter subunit C [Bacteroidales bacterium]|nr:Na+/H+ antiporter subunit C [Bacteroidales bacterium]